MTVPPTELPAGRELDREIAVRVIGWVLEEPDNRDCWVGWEHLPPNLLEWRRGRGRGLRADPAMPIPHMWKSYSTSIEAAWEVVEELRAKTSYPIRFSVMLVQGSHVAPAIWRARFGGAHREGEGDTPELAICRAALFLCWGEGREVTTDLTHDECAFITVTCGSWNDLRFVHGWPWNWKRWWWPFPPSEFGMLQIGVDLAKRGLVEQRDYHGRQEFRSPAEWLTPNDPDDFVPGKLRKPPLFPPDIRRG